MQQGDAASPPYKRAPHWASVGVFFFNKQKYLDLAVSHGMAINLEAPDLAKKFHDGTFPPPGWEKRDRADASNGRSDLLRALRHSLYAMSIVTALALTVLWVAGKVNFDFPIAWPKVFGGTGTFLIGWSALFELGEYWKSWDGIALHELVRPKLFMVLFLPGVLLATIGQLW